ncbi:MAG: hypothetical protein IPJ65_02420 [Archangiaceae bacterium]|nr:hypothetical protein [Archangiaceae bacterium]
MTLPLAALVVLSAAAPLKLAAPGLQAVGIEEKRAQVFTDFLAQQLSQYGIRVTTQAEVQALLGLERQKQLLGCSDEAGSCMAELAGALGVDGLITGNVARLDKEGFVLTLKIVRANDASAMGNYSSRVADDAAAFDWMAARAKDFAVAQGLYREPEPGGVHLRGLSWVPLAVGVVAAGVGAGLLGESYSVASKLQRGEGASPDSLDATISGASTRQVLGAVLVGVGAAALVTAVVFFITGSDPPAQVAALLTPNGGVFSAAWRLP